MQKTITINKKKIKIYFKLKYDNREHYLNVNLIKVQDLTIQDIKDIIRIHKSLDWLFLQIVKENNFKRLRSLGKLYHKYQFALQKIWGFEKDLSYHKFWTLPKCACPKMDNEDRYPCGHYIYDYNCPMHGKVKNGMVTIESIN